MGKAVGEVQAGICGFTVRIAAWTDEEEKVRLELETDCPNVAALAEDLTVVDPLRVVAGQAKDGPVFAAAARQPLHPACPVPIGILKAVEVAAGYALPRDAVIKVERG